MTRNKCYDNIKTKQKDTIQNQGEKKRYERKNLLQCRRHCKDARCEYGKILQDFVRNEQGTGWKRFPYNRRQNSGGVFS